MNECAIVGSGLAALVAYATLRHAGVPVGAIAVFGTNADPTEAWRVRAESIRQQRMRSESDGHVAAASWPGLAVREAWTRRRPRPLWQTLASRYHPTVERFLEHAASVREHTGWSTSFRLARVERVAAVDGGFEIDGQGLFRHVLLATGHPGLALPGPFATDPRVVHAYQPHEYGSHVAVVGTGMAAATEWLNALAAGSEVVSIRRRPPLRRPLNVDRPLFSKRGLAGFHVLDRPTRAALLADLARASFPPGDIWDEPLARAERDGRFRVAHAGDRLSREIDQIICATGFRRGFAADPLLARLAREHGLENEGRWLVLAPDSTVPALTDARRTLALAGAQAQWAFPAADTIAGAKYAAHGFLGRVCRSR
ncbi:MAG TPA: hypothetical protein VHP82_04205 [Gaiellaceae bacterium]|jgi:hypothetical protein|nr:hypothetical protein [Gaiellaceae bacterium]